MIFTLTCTVGSGQVGTSPYMLSESQCLAWHAIPLIVTAGELKKITEYMHFDEVETSKIGHYWHICNQKLTNPCMGDAKEGDHYSCLGSSIPKFSWNLQGRVLFFLFYPFHTWSV